MAVNGHNDTFIINDIELRIPPTAIKITKDSLNYQWQTLRTNTSQKTKSGHSTITVEFTAAFVSFDDIHLKLKPLIAQLRYMPFCFVENQFLRENLFPQDKREVHNTADVNTIVLAFRAAAITARNDTPGTIWVNFQFAYFNYLPYTPFWQYKQDLFGDDALKSTTFPGQSDAWLKFINPAVSKSTVAESKTGQAKIKFIELRTAPVSSTQSIDDTKRLLQSINQNQKQFFDKFRSPTGDTPDQAIANAAREAFPQFQNLKDIAAGDLLGPLLINAGPSSNPLSKRYRSDAQYLDQNQLKQTFAELDQRSTQRALIESGPKEDRFEQIQDLTFQDNRGQGFGVFKKLRAVNLNADNGIIIEGITISIQNILATIPVIGHRYATFQHIGSIDATVILDMKVTNDTGMSQLSWFYDTANENMITNRHIPQGLQTIKIDNDVLALFNLQEFITQDMDSCTIEGSPGTYAVKVSLIESGIKQNSTLDDTSDKFSLEFASQDDRVTREIIKILNSNVQTIDNSTGIYFGSKVSNPRSSRFGNIVNKYIGVAHENHHFVNQAIENNPFLNQQLNQNGGASAGGLFNALFGKSDPVSEQPDIVNTSTSTSLNNFADEVSSIIFANKIVAADSSFTGTVDNPADTLVSGNLNLYNALLALTDDDVPGISKVQEVVTARAKKQQQLDTGIVAIANQPLSDQLAQARNKSAKGAQIDTIRRQKALFQKINFDSTDVPFTANAIGLNEAPPSTIEGQKFEDLLNTSTESILKLKPFTQWAEFVSSLTTAIIESDDIDLAELASAKKLVNETGLGRGLPAYPDFDLQSLIPPEKQNSIDDLLSLDPDCYLLSPTDVSMDKFIDPALIANAKRIAQTSSESALNQINKFYNDSWLPSFVSDYIRDAVKTNISQTIKQNGTDGQVNASSPINVDSYYIGSTQVGMFPNAGSLPGASIQLGSQKFDSGQTHASIVDVSTLSSGRLINHSMNPTDLFSMPQTGNGIQTFTSDPVTSAPKASRNSNGRLVTKSNVQNGIVTDSPQALASAAGTDLDTYAIARCIASEVGSQNEATKIAIGWACKNAAREQNKTPYAWLTGGNLDKGFFGHGGGRLAASNQDPHEQDLRIAKLVSTNQVPDPTGGATQWSDVRAQNSPAYRNAVAQLDVSQGRKPRRVLSENELIDFRSKKGIVTVSVDGVDSNQTVFFKKANAKPKAYTPPTPSVPNPDSGINAGQNVADLSIQAFQTSLKNGQAMRMVRAFPTYKLYFIQDNSGNRRRFGLDDFYSYNAVADILCVRSRKIPADLLEITLTNVSGVLSNRKFQGPRLENNDGGLDASGEPLDKNGEPISRDPNGFLTKNSKQQNTLASMMLQPGIDVQLKLGYSNDPKDLTDVFNGKIMEVEFSESDDLVRVICQSHAIELVQDMKGMAEPVEKKGFFVSDARTDFLLESLMAEPELVHFGRWVRSASVNTDSNTNRFLLTDKFKLHPSPQDDNIFVPSIDILRKLDPGFLFSGIKYTIYQTTIWDIFDEMTLRHPGWIRSAVPYKDKFGPRMTMFFGLPSQLYFAADPSNEEKTIGSHLRSQVDQYNNTVDQLNKSWVINPELLQEVKHSDVAVRNSPGFALGTGLSTQFQKTTTLASKLKPKDFATERLEVAKKFQSIRPFRSYHLVTSKHHIIANNIRASAKGTHNTVSVQYGNSTYNKDTKQLVQEGTDVLTLGVDAAMPDEDVRELFVQYPNCQSKMMAKNYALGYLMKELRDVYRGELTIIGNPDIKPYDIVTIFDDYNDIMGPIEVEQVIHRFSQDTGFITEITPDLFVTANEWVNMTANDMMSIIIEGAASALNHGTPTTTETVATNPLVKAGALSAFALGVGVSPLIAILGAGAAIGGYFMMQKMVDFTSHGQPVVIHPLIHRGKPFVAGLPINKLNNLWSTNKGEWFKEAFDGLGLWWDDFNDKLVLAANQGSALNLFSGNGLPPKF